MKQAAWIGNAVQNHTNDWKAKKKAVWRGLFLAALAGIACMVTNGAAVPLPETAAGIGAGMAEIVLLAAAGFGIVGITAA